MTTWTEGVTHNVIDWYAEAKAFDDANPDFRVAVERKLVPIVERTGKRLVNIAITEVIDETHMPFTQNYRAYFNEVLDGHDQRNYPDEKAVATNGHDAEWEEYKATHPGVYRAVVGYLKHRISVQRLPSVTRAIIQLRPSGIGMNNSYSGAIARNVKRSHPEVAAHMRFRSTPTQKAA